MKPTLIIPQSSFELASMLEGYADDELIVIRGSHSTYSGLHRFQNFTVPPGLLTMEAVAAAQKLFNRNTKMIVAIGGGRIIDAAKLLLNDRSPRPQFLALPTTAGSGSEATPFAVYYKGLEKQSLENVSLSPDLAILDAGLLQGLSPRLRAGSVADALAQAVESYWNKRATEVSKRFARTAISILLPQMTSHVHDSNSRFDRDMLYGAHLSGRAIALTRTTGCHALSYYLTSHHGIPHGEAVALFLPLFFLYNEEAGLQELSVQLSVKNAGEAFEKLQTLFSDCGLPVSFSGYGIEVDIEALIASVNHQRFSNNPVAFDAERLQLLIQQRLR